MAVHERADGATRGDRRRAESRGHRRPDGAAVREGRDEVAGGDVVPDPAQRVDGARVELLVRLAAAPRCAAGGVHGRTGGIVGRHLRERLALQDPTSISRSPGRIRSSRPRRAASGAAVSRARDRSDA